VFGQSHWEHFFCVELSSAIDNHLAALEPQFLGYPLATV